MPSTKSSEKTLSPSGELWLKQDGKAVLGESRMALLEALDETGSITGAAGKTGVSYKTAWDALDLLNNLSHQPLIETATGGKKGGGSRLTPHGRELVKLYRALSSEHEKYLERLRSGYKDFDRFFKLSQQLSLKISARNQLTGTIASIKRDSLIAEVVLKLKGKDRVVSHITLGSLENLGLRKNENAYALIKANWISLMRTGAKIPKGFENQLNGRIESLRESGRNAEVVLRLPGGNSLVTALTRENVREFGLKEGVEATALFKAAHVILGVVG